MKVPLQYYKTFGDFKDATQGLQQRVKALMMRFPVGPAALGQACCQSISHQSVICPAFRATLPPVFGKGFEILLFDVPPAYPVDRLNSEYCRTHLRKQNVPGTAIASAENKRHPCRKPREGWGRWRTRRTPYTGWWT